MVVVLTVVSYLIWKKNHLITPPKYISLNICIFQTGNYRDTSIAYRTQFQERTSRLRTLSKTFIQGTSHETWMTNPKDFTCKFEMICDDGDIHAYFQ